MKVHIGPYTPWWSTSRFTHFYYKLRYDKYEFEVDNKDRFDYAVEWMIDKWQDYVCHPVNRVINSRRKRKINVRIDNYDCWSLDHTLAQIILPALKRLQSIKHGSPCVEDQDVPEHLRCGKSIDQQFASEDEVRDVDFEKRWEYVLGEMIFAFEQAAGDDYGQFQFHHNSDQLEMKFKPIGNGLNEIGFEYQKDPTKPKYWVDYEAKTAHMDRVRNGLRLFGKYYMALWD